MHGWSSTIEGVVFHTGGGGLRPSGPSSGSTGRVRIMIRVRERCSPNIHMFVHPVNLRYIGRYRSVNCKMVGVWRTSIGTVEDVVRDRRGAGSDSDCNERISVNDGSGVPHT